MQIGRTKLLCLVVLLFPFCLNAQNFIYVNNQSGTANSISSFSVDTGGVLTSVATVSTGGVGATVACTGIDRITVNGASNLLFVSNSGDQSISVFRITPATGALTAVAGSPFASGLTLDSCAGISLASTPDGKFLMASSNGVIKTFSVGVNGALSLSATAPGLPSPMVGMKVSGDGRFLAVSHQASVSVFTISGVDGSLTAVAGSPFAKTGTGLVGGVEFNCDGTLLYAAEGGAASSISDAWSVATTGALTPIAGSPFTSAGNDSNVVFLSPDNTALFLSNQGSNDMNYFTVNSDGTLTSVGAFNDGLGRKPGGLASDNSGLFLFSANDGVGMDVFNIVPGAVATLVTNTVGGITGAGQVQGIAAYPPRSCAQADFSITQTATPSPVNAGSQITYNITITNNGPSAASVAINDLLPRNFVTFTSCTPGAGGVCDKGAGLNRTVTFASLASGQTGSATIVATAVSTLLNGDTITNTATVSNASAVDPNRANNSSTTNVTVSAPLSASKLVPAAATGSYFGTTNLSATLTRVLNSAPVAGRTVTFSILGIVAGTAQTNASGIATLSNVSIAGINAGTYVGGVTVTFAGDSQYQASSGSSTLTVNKAPLTVTTQNATKVYGDPNPGFTYVITGFLNNETTAVVTGTANCNTSAGTTSAAGNYPITCSVGTLSATNYSFVFVPAALSVTRAPLVLAANSVSRLYGDPNPALTGSVVGLKGTDKANANFAVAAVSTSPVGAYPIVGTVVPVSGFNANNYSITSSGSLTINPAPLTATANSASRVYGDANPAFTGTLTGAKNGEVLTASFSSTADLTSAVGSYPITATLTTPANLIGNYTITANSGSLTITAAALTVAAGNASRAYGDANAAFSGTITGIKNGDNITATYASAADPTSAVGTFPIVPTLADPTTKLGNYSVTITNGTLTVGPAALTVAAGNASRLYGDANLVFGGTITGIRNGDNITATYVSAADPTSAVGTFAIVPTLADPTTKLGNYSVTLTNGTLTINPAPLSVAGANASRLYGDANGAFSGTIAGLKNGDAITASFASAATASSAVGSYPIVPSLADPTNKLGNYSVTITNGALTVNAAPLTVTAANASRVVGKPDPAFTGTIVGIRNGDNITATFATTATAASPAGTYPIVPTLVDPTGKLGNYAVTSNNGTLTIIGLPVPLSVTPNAGTGTTAVLQAVYSDPSGANRLTDVRLQINNVLSGPSGCYMRYTQNTNQLFLLNDTNTAFLGPITPGSAATLENSQCVLNGANTSVIAAGNNLTVNFSLSFKPAFIAVKNVYLFANDTISNVNSGWQLLGSWSLPVPPPTAVSVTPNVGTGSAAVLQALYSDDGGAARLGDVRLQVNRVLSGTSGCYVRYLRGTNQVFLLNDTNTAFVGPITPGSATTVENSQCIVNGVTTTVLSAANNLTVNFSLTFKASFVGAKNIYLYASDTSSNVNSGWQLLGTWTLTAPNPSVVSVTPSSGSGSSAVLQALYSDPAGATNLGDVRLQINNVVSGLAGCYVRYLRGTNQLFLLNDTNTTFLGPITAGVAGTVENSQCVLDGATSSATALGSNLTLNLSVSFKSAFVGAKNIYLFANDTIGGVNTGWQQRGTWVVQ